MMIDDNELRSIFKTASEEHLQNLDSYLLHLEKHPGDEAAIEAALREAHSLKGDANMLGLKEIGALAHQIEHILSQLKRRENALTAELSDRLAHGLTALASLVHEAVTGEPSGVDTFRVLAELMGSSSPVAENGNNGVIPNSGEALAAESQNLHQASESISLPQSATLTPAALTVESSPKEYRIETIRVATQNLDTLMTQTGELTVTKIRIAHRLAEIETISSLWEEWSRDLFNNRFAFEQSQQNLNLDSPLKGFHNRTEQRLEQLGYLLKTLHTALYEDTARLDLISKELEEGVRLLRMLPLSTIFNLFPRLVRDLARHEGKSINLVIEGGETQADKRILEEMKDPLMHILRNAIDHGIEPPTEREQLGKPATAIIRLRGYQTPTSVVLEVSDDGRGLDTEKIKQTALKRGICKEEDLATMSLTQIHALIFAPGFSTAAIVTEVSGRGVGLDIVRANVEKLKGTIQVESESGRGCTIRIQLGLTLATAHVLIVRLGESLYAIPVEFVSTACLVKPEEIFTLEGRETIVRAGQPVSVARLAELLELPSNKTKPGKNQQSQTPCIILQSGEEKIGVFVDAVVDEQDVVLKPQSQLLKRVRNVSGATILGTGEVCPVLNPPDLIKSIRRWACGVKLQPSPALNGKKQSVLLVEDSIATRTQERRILESAGYEVVTAVDGLDGFSKLLSRPFDAVVSDVQMPNLDGLSLAARIRQHKEYNEVPIILVTSLATDADKRRGVEAGANAYITKGSFNQEVLLETLQRLI